MAETPKDSYRTLQAIGKCRVSVEAFNELFDRHRHTLKVAVGLRMTNSLRARFDESDVVQETYAEAFRRFDVDDSDVSLLTESFRSLFFDNDVSLPMESTESLRLDFFSFLSFFFDSEASLPIESMESFRFDFFFFSFLDSDASLPIESIESFRLDFFFIFFDSDISLPNESIDSFRLDFFFSTFESDVSLLMESFLCLFEGDGPSLPR